MGKKAVLMQQGRGKNAAQNGVMQPAKEKNAAPCSADEKNTAPAANERKKCHVASKGESAWVEHGT
jgi:hypothetical protein